MQILFLSNFYPPVSRGGYEQWCQEVAEGLVNRQHEVIVLTSNYGRQELQEPEPAWIRRDLHLEMEFASMRNGLQFFTSRKAREEENLSRLERVIEEFEPDVVLIWGMWNLPRSLPAQAENLKPGSVVYYMGDYWPTLPNQFEDYWQVPPQNWFTSVPKFFLKRVARQMLAGEERPALRFDHVIFPTAFMEGELRSKGISPQETKIIYGAIDTGLYPYHNGRSNTDSDENLSLLYVGRLSAEKGVHTAIEALGYLVHELGYSQLRLTIAGTGEPEDETHLRQLVRQEKVESIVAFIGAQPKEAMPELYHRADIFLFTSIWPEPFGRVLVEAMASGVAVVGSVSGGAAEILVENENALCFVPGDVIGLANQIARLVESPSLRRQLIKTGRQTALTKFDVGRMTNEIEAYLQTIVDGS